MTGNTNLRILYSFIAILTLAAIALALSGENQALFLFLNRELQLASVVFWSNMTFVADTLFAVAAISLIAALRHPQLFNSGLVLLITGAVFVQSLKFYLDVGRPGLLLEAETFHVIGPLLKYHSFPSGHSFTSMAAFGLLALYTKRPSLVMLLLIIGFMGALSRIAVGAHWPMDVLVGSATGLMFAILAKKLVEQLNWLQGRVFQTVAASLMTLSCIGLIFHDSRYPHTELLTAGSGVLATLACLKYWWAKIRN